MTRVVVAALAEQDSTDILDHLAKEAGRSVAERYAADIERLFAQLERFPRSGSRRPRLGRRVRIGVIAPYVVFYEYAEADDLVRVLRILHGHRRAGPKQMR